MFSLKLNLIKLNMFFIMFNEKGLKKYRTHAMKISKKITGYLKFMCFF